MKILISLVVIAVAILLLISKQKRERNNVMEFLRQAQEATSAEQAQNVLWEMTSAGYRNSVAAEIAREKRDSLALKQAQAAETIEQTVNVLNVSCSGSPAEKLAKEKWDWLSLKEVLAAKTFNELAQAKRRARKGSPAVKIAPIVREEIAILEIAIAGADVEKLVTVATFAPKGGVAKSTAVAKLRRLHSSISVSEKNG